MAFDPLFKLQLQLRYVIDQGRKQDVIHRKELRTEIAAWEAKGGRQAWEAWCEAQRCSKTTAA